MRSGAQGILTGALMTIIRYPCVCVSADPVQTIRTSVSSSITLQNYACHLDRRYKVCYAFHSFFLTSGARPSGGLYFRLGRMQDMKNKTFRQ